MKQKSVGIDILRVLSMVCVVILHSVSNGLRSDFGTDTWNTINWISSFATCAVPIFFMISGYLLLNSEHTNSVSYTVFNRIPRLIVPLFVWSLIYIIVVGNMDALNRDIPIDIDTIWENISMFHIKECAVHFWFMYYMIPLYLAAPFLKAACDKSGDKAVAFLLFLWAITLTLNVLSKFADEEYAMFYQVAFLKNIGVISGYGGYFLLGWFLGNKKFKYSRILFLILAIVSVYYIAYGTQYFTDLTGEYDEWIKSYNSIAVCILSASVFILLKDIKFKMGTKVIAWLSSLSYGVYLCHNMFLYLITELNLGRTTGDEMYRNFWIVLGLSIAIIGVLSTVKYINFIFAGVDKKYS